MLSLMVFVFHLLCSAKKEIKLCQLSTRCAIPHVESSVSFAPQVTLTIVAMQFESSDWDQISALRSERGVG